MKRNLLATLVLMVCGFSLHAQEYVYSLNQFTPLIYHPAYAASDNEASLSFLNRKTQIGGGYHYQNNIVNAEYPLIDTKKGKRLGGIGMHFLQKDAGNSDLLESVSLGISVAYNLQVVKDQFLSFGLQTNYNNQKTSLKNLTSGSQWIASEFRFDPSAPLGEPIRQSRVNYFSVNAGFLWYMVDKSTHEQRAFIGLSAFNMNKPNRSFFEAESKVPVGYLANAGAVAYHKGSYQLTPQVLYQYDNYSHAVNALVSNKLFFKNDNPYDVIKSGSVEFLTKYDFKNDLGLGVVFHQPSISFGFNYNIPLAGNSADQYFNNAMEFGVRLSKLIWKPQPKKVAIASTTAPVRRNFEFGNSQTTQVVQESRSEADIIQKSIEEYSKVTAVQFELEKNFKFEFGRTELNSDAKVFLDDLYKLLEKNPEYQLEVIGHTDNVGKPLINYKLSSGRARAVADYLQQKGLSKDRVQWKGMGDTQAVAPNDTEENRAKNRRVQFVIYVNR